MTCSEKGFAKTNLSVFRLHRTTAQSGSVAQLVDTGLGYMMPHVILRDPGLK